MHALQESEESNAGAVRTEECAVGVQTLQRLLEETWRRQCVRQVHNVQVQHYGALLKQLQEMLMKNNTCRMYIYIYICIYV